jgi:hypothetical protein
MDADDDAVLRLAAQRHPASRGVGTLHLAQHRLAEAVRAFLRAMAEAEYPGVRPLPAPKGRNRWPRGHQARHTSGWPVPAEVDRPFQCWIDQAGRWWMLRFDVQGYPLDAHTVGTPLRLASDLPRFTGALEEILRACRVTP